MEAFETIHQQYQQDIFSYIHSRVTNEETAQNLTREVFCSVYRAWDKYKERQPFPPAGMTKEWLMGIALFAASNYHKFNQSN